MLSAAPQLGHRRAFVTVSRGNAPFRKSDVTRGIKALESAGKKLGRVEISEGKIILFPDNKNGEDENSEEIKL
jgi:hypothetical protein